MFKDSTINLSNVKKCNQVWELMPRLDEGRLCTKCDKKIHDFRGKLDWEIALAHAHSEVKLCGLYDKKMLTDVRTENSKNRKYKGLMFLGTVGLLATGSPALSQNNKPISVSPSLQSLDRFSMESNTIFNIPFQNSSSIVKDSFYLVSGVLKSETGPISGAAVVVKGTPNGMLTDKDGGFQLDITKELNLSDSIELIASVVGYSRKEFTIHKSAFNQDGHVYISIVLNQQSLEAITFKVERSPIHKRVWYRIKNIFRKKKN